MIEGNLRYRLQVLQGTLRKACAADGAGRLLFTLVAGLLACIVLDYFFFRLDRPVNTAFRIVMLLGFLGTLSLIAYFRLIAPLRVPLSLDDMALAVEKEFPQLNDSLISAVQLARIMADDRYISPAMIKEVVWQAYESTAELDFKRVVKFQRIKPVLFAAGAAAAVFLLLLLTPLRPFVTTGLVRVCDPLSSAEYPVRTFIEVTMDGATGSEKIVPRNDALSIVAVVRGDLPSKARIQFDHGKGFGREELLTPAGTRYDPVRRERYKEFRYDYSPVISSFKFVVLAGDNQTNDRFVRAVDRPELVNLLVSYELPSYISETATPPKRERSLRNVVGAKAHLQGDINKPLRSAMLKLGNDPAREMELSLDKTRFVATIPLEETKDYEITLLDRDGLDNRQNKIRHKVWVLPDALPRVTWRKPAVDLEVSPMAVVALSLGAEDDFGLKRAGIKFRRYKGATVPEPANQVPGARNVAPAAVDTNSPAIEGGFDLPEPQPGAFNHSAQRLDLGKDWVLSELGVEPGDLVEYWAEAYDWCPAPRKGVEPQIYRLRVFSPEEIRRRLDVERLRLLEDLKVIIRDQEGDKKQVEAIKDHLAVGNPFDTPDRTKVSEAGVVQEEVRRKTQALQNAFDSLIARYVSNGLDTPDDRDRLQSIRDVLETEHSRKMPDAAREIAATSTAKTDDDRKANLNAAIKKQDEILADLRALLEQMQKWAETEDLLRLTRELLLKQRNVTRLTSEFKDRLGVKRPTEATKDEQGQVKALAHEQRDCANDMKQLFDRMTQALAKMMDLDKWVAKNIDDAIKIAQNTDATPENPDLAAGGDPHPGIEDKMRAAQSDILGKDNEPYGFGMAGGKQRAVETGLERIITVLSRRRDVDQQLMRDIDQSKRDLQRILERQRELTKQTANIQDKATLEKNIAEARKRVQELYARQQKLLDETRTMQNTPDPQAAALEAGVEDLRQQLDALIKEQTQVFNETVAALSPAEREAARAVHELDALEAEERALAKESVSYADGRAARVLKERYEAVKQVRVQNEDLRAKAVHADSLLDKAKAAAELRGLQDAQSKLHLGAAAAVAALKPAAETLAKEAPKDAPKDSPQAAAWAAALRALEQAASLALNAPDEVKAAAERLGAAQGKEALAAQLNATDKLARAEEVLLKALSLERKRFEDGMVDGANRQADTRGRLDEVANRVALLIRAANTPDQAAKDPKLAVAVKGAQAAMVELEGSSHGMAEAADTMRRAAGANDPNGARKASEMQTGAADRIAKARAALLGASDEMGKDKRADHAKTGQRQGQVQDKAKTLQTQIEKVALDIEKAHAAAAGTQPQAGDPRSAAQKVGAAAQNMADAVKDLGKPSPSGAVKNESKAIDALEEAKSRLGDLRRKVEELKTPPRRLERQQKDVKDEARQVASDVKGLEDQLPQQPTDAKASDNIKSASNSMQNAQNSLNAAGDSKAGAAQSASDSKEATKEQERALTELEKALKALDELAGKAKKEQDPRIASALDRLRPPQSLLRDDVLKLQKKLDQFRDKTGNKNADKAARATQSASKNQSAASSQMGQGNQGGTKSSQDEAEQDLQDALDNLDQFQQQMAQQNRNEQLFQIEQELKKMVAAEKEILGKTQDVEKQRPAAGEQLPRRAKLMVKQVFGDQLKLGEATTVIVKKLAESLVFQFVLQTAANDMNEAATRLDREESGQVTQDIQDDVVRQLNDLIEALRKERTKPRQGGGGGGGGGGKQPLVPPLAELKMLQIMQRNVNVQTKKVDEEATKARTQGKDLTKDQKDRLRRAALKESEISRITKRIADELDSGGSQPPPPGGPPDAPPDGN